MHSHKPEVREIKSDSEISCHITLMSVIHGSLLDARYLTFCSSWCEVGCKTL